MLLITHLFFSLDGYTGRLKDSTSMPTGEETGLLMACLVAAPGMRKKLGEPRNSGAATLQFAWNVEHSTHAFEIRKLAWAIVLVY